ncbi:hypothetical protein QSE00_24580 [Arenibacter sp. M-2]|uniref:hypothetical protein n=1 Tax=Arenibacter sp. M-2 TaxID=3053612 RepID=UPI0025706C82|nr:hypothetical protein [Arenibacter sp. M-2]MDL5515009.1 hypothetical protein [Arenibacter sp. M-2]
MKTDIVQKKKFEILEQEFKKTSFDDGLYECCYCFEKEKENFKNPECNRCSIKEEEHTFQQLEAYVKTNKQKLELLNLKITSNIFYIKSLEIYLKARVEKAEASNVELLNELAYTSKFVNDIKNKDFTDYSNFIFKAITSTTSTKPKSFVASNDGTEIKIKLINLYTKDTIKSKAFDFYSRNEWSFDFSSGFFFNNQVENSYFLQAREGDTTRISLVKESNRDFDVSFGAMGHLSYKFSSGFKAGIGMGASLSPLDAKTRYLLGGSMIFGNKNQLSLNIGASFVKLKVLSGSVNEDSEGKFVAPSVTTVPTFERIKRGLYFGVTYNLTSKKKYQD